MVVVDGLYICCCAEGSGNKGSYILFFTACMNHFETYCRRWEVLVVYIYFSICIYPVTAGSNVNGP